MPALGFDFIRYETARSGGDHQLARHWQRSMAIPSPSVIHFYDRRASEFDSVPSGIRSRSTPAVVKFLPSSSDPI
jgi:hypothetical protein